MTNVRIMHFLHEDDEQIPCAAQGGRRMIGEWI
jgi:hypothetical protein